VELGKRKKRAGTLANLQKALVIFSKKIYHGFLAVVNSAQVDLIKD